MNVNGTKLELCSMDPVTGYNRTGYCNVDESDRGTHTVCATMTDEFLKYSQSKGNDLINPNHRFPGLEKGDKWCLCALRWKEANNAGVAPPVVRGATHDKTLEFTNLDTTVGVF
jgi:uncharacterized protein